MHGWTEWALTALVFLSVFGLVGGLYSGAVMSYRSRNDVTTTTRRGMSGLVGLLFAVLCGLAAAAVAHNLLFAVNPPV